MGIVVRMAKQWDIPAMKRLLKKGDLHTEGIERHIEHFLVAEENRNGEVVGTAGMEVFGSNGLLRSLAVSSETGNAKLGLELLRIMLAFARKKGVRNLYLLSGRSHQLFDLFGFEQLDWEQVPEELKESSHLQQYQPERMCIMVYRFPQ